jgi:hypothetical protein
MRAEHAKLTWSGKEETYSSLYKWDSGEDSAILSKQTKIINTTRRYFQTSGHK